MIDLDELEGLEEQRAFLLRSLRDLEREHDAGDIDEADYATLKDDYTARAAAVLRAIDAGKVSQPPTRHGRRWRVIAMVVAVVGAGVLAGGLLARTSGERVAGDQVSGSIRQSSASEVQRADSLFATGKPVDALRALDAVLKRDPGNAAALSHRGWYLVLAGRQAGDKQLLDKGLADIDRAIAADAAYPDAHFYKGLVLLQDRGDPAGAVPELQRFLASNPPAGQVGPVQDILRQAQAAAAAKGQ
jgi:tetratricopeptide (TPR) repeat protein